MFDIIPITFVIDLSSENCEANLNQFIKFYEHNAPQNL